LTTQITDSMSMAVAALDAMDNHAALVREVAARLLSEHASGLPKLIEVRPFAGCGGPRLELQPRTNADAAAWAQALGVALTEDVVETRGGRRLHVSGELLVDGVRVRLGSCQSFSSAAWAARTAEAVAA
jgi:hypothetical protein